MYGCGCARGCGYFDGCGDGWPVDGNGDDEGCGHGTGDTEGYGNIDFTGEG